MDWIVRRAVERQASLNPSVVRLYPIRPDPQQQHPRRHRFGRDHGLPDCLKKGVLRMYKMIRGKEHYDGLWMPGAQMVEAHEDARRRIAIGRLQEQVTD